MGSPGLAPIELDLPGARVAFSTRAGGVSEGPYASLNLGFLTDDDSGRVERNHGLLAERLGMPPSAVARLRQVHGAEIVDWDEPAEPSRSSEDGSNLPETWPNW